jgi:predicted O-methyltransferase YrrM
MCCFHGHDELSMALRIKALAKYPIGVLHRAALRAGVVVLPNHYYASIADVHELHRLRKLWAKRSAMIGVDMNVAAQADELLRMVKAFEPEYRGNAVYMEGTAKGFGPGFGYIEAQCLHGVLRALKPRRVCEVGSGVSTYCTLRALGRNESEGHCARLTCIEPNPSKFLRSMRGKGVELIERPVQAMDPDFFRALEAGDLLFIDTTHAVKPGGDVIYLYLEVLPRLRPGVIVHIHDIYLPYLYQRDLLQLRNLFQWSETALLLAFLVNNHRLSVLFCLSLLHYDAPAVLSEVFPEYRPQPADDGLCARAATGHFPSSIYLRMG